MFLGDIFQTLLKKKKSSGPGKNNKTMQLISRTLTELTAEDLKDVTSISNAAFAECTNLVSVVIPEGVTSIGNSAFSDCTNLVSVVIPASVLNAGSNVFRNCNSLSEIYCEGDISSWVKIKTYSYNEGVLLNKGCNLYVKNDSGEYELLEGDVIIPEGVSEITAHVFRYYTNITSVVIPEGVTNIGNYAFQGCTNLVSVVIPEGVTSIGNSAFSDCTNLVSVVIPEGVTSIGTSLFSSCTNLVSVVIPEGITSINNFMFNSCSSLTSISIPDSVTKLGTQAFYECKKLDSITIPASVTTIDNAALKVGNWNRRTTITFLGTTPPTIASSIFNTTYMGKIIVPKGCGEVYKSATNWAKVADYIEEATE